MQQLFIEGHRGGSFEGSLRQEFLKKVIYEGSGIQEKPIKSGEREKAQKDCTSGKVHSQLEPQEMCFGA